MKNVFLMALMFLLSINAYSQGEHQCGTHEVMSKYLNENPEFRAKAREYEVNQAKSVKLKSVSKTLGDGNIVEIPVVFHVVESNSTTPETDFYVSKQQIEEGLEMLNNQLVYRTTPNGIDHDLEVRFVLAERDVSGDFTSGIFRYKSPYCEMEKNDDHLLKSTIQQDNDNVRNGIDFPVEQYCNIYIVDNIIGSVAGYSTLPTILLDEERKNFDGIVFESQYIGISEELTRVFVHEVGHYLGLYHTFRYVKPNCNPLNEDCISEDPDPSWCAPETDCEIEGDMICDTPLDFYKDGVCSLDGKRTCEYAGGDEPIHNYMDYSGISCINHFTQGQGEKMIGVISTDGLREDLICDHSNPDSKCNTLCTNPIVLEIFPEGESLTLLAGETNTFLNNSLLRNGSSDISDYEFTWNFGDGTEEENTIGNSSLEHIYLEEGRFTIKITAVNEDESCSQSIELLVSVHCEIEPQFLFNGEYAFLNTMANIGEAIELQSTTANSTEIEWLIDGVSIGRTENITYTFTEAGTYILQLKAFNGLCYKTSNNLIVDVGGNCKRFSGNEYNNWFFARNGLNFNSGEPITIANINNGLASHEGCASISDKEGNLLFYTNGIEIKNRNHVLMDGEINGNLKGHSSTTQGAVIIPHPNVESNNIFYVFTAAAQFNQVNPEPERHGLHYYIVDFSNGLSSTSQNTSDPLYGLPLGHVSAGIEGDEALLPLVGEKIVAVKSSNNSIYLIVRGIEDIFYVFTIDETGLNEEPSIYHGGIFLTQEHRGTDAIGNMKISPDGTFLALCQSTGSVMGNHSLEIFRFNPVSGELGELLTTIIPYAQSYGLEFSPNSQFLYYGSHSCIMQLDLEAIDIPNSAQIIGCGENPYLGFKSLQLGPNGKIYTTRGGDAIGVIENPNIKGNGCTFKPLHVQLPNEAHSGFPNTINSLKNEIPNLSGPTCVETYTSDIVINSDVVLNDGDNVIWKIIEAEPGVEKIAEIISSNGASVNIDVYGEGDITIVSEYHSNCGTVFSYHNMKVSCECSSLNKGTYFDIEEEDVLTLDVNYEVMSVVRSNFTVEATVQCGNLQYTGTSWVYNILTNNGYPLDPSSYYRKGFVFGLNRVGGVVVMYGGYVMLYTDIQVNDEQCHHVAFSVEREFTTGKDQVTIYVDGEIAKQAIVDSYDIYTRKEFQISGFGDVVSNFYHANPFDGNVSELRVWNDLRTPAEIFESHNTILEGNEEGLVGYWKLNDKYGQLIVDYSPLANHGYRGLSLDEETVDPIQEKMCCGSDEDNDDLTTAYYLDSDGDSYGDSQAYTVTYTRPKGFVLNNFDCDDQNSDVLPNAEELCDGIDNNCNGYIDENCECMDLTVDFTHSNACFGETLVLNGQVPADFDSIQWIINGKYISSNSTIEFPLTQMGTIKAELAAYSNTRACVRLVEKTIEITGIGEIYGLREICEGQDGVEYFIEPGYESNFLWSVDGVTDNITQNGISAVIDFGETIQTGNHVVVSTSFNGCNLEQQLELEVLDCYNSDNCNGAQALISTSRICPNEDFSISAIADNIFDMFHWYINDLQISNEKNFTHEIAQAGEYELKLVAESAANGCVATSIKNISLPTFGPITGPESVCINSDSEIFTLSSTEQNLTLDWYSSNSNLIEEVDDRTINLHINNVTNNTETLTAESIIRNCEYSASHNFIYDNCDSTALCEPILNLASEWALLNTWNDRYAGSQIATSSNGLEVIHRAWGQNYIWLVKNVGTYNLETDKDYQVNLQLENTNDPNNYIKQVDVTFAQNLTWSGPVVNQETYSESFSSYQQNITVNAPLSVSSNGNYYLCVKIDFGQQITNQAQLAMHDMEFCTISGGLKYSISPNPFTNEVIIEPENPQKTYEATLYDSKGAVIKTGISKGTYTFLLDDALASGVYTLKLISEEKVETFKLIKAD